MESNPFSQMVGALRGTDRPAFPIVDVPLRSHEPSKTERLRQLIKAQGPVSPLSLAVQIDLEGGAGLVRALLKSDFDRKSVIARNGKYLWNPQFDADLHEQLRAAERLLRGHGYEVKRPEEMRHD